MTTTPKGTPPQSPASAYLEEGIFPGDDDDQSTLDSEEEESDDHYLEEEDPADYSTEGYRITHPFEMLTGGYRIKWKLGHGTYATVWLAEKGRYLRICLLSNVMLPLILNLPSGNNRRCVAVKIVRSDARLRGNLMRELHHLGIINSKRRESGHAGARNIAQMLGFFSVPGTNDNARHGCFSFEPLGEHLLDLTERFRPDLSSSNLYRANCAILTKRLTRQILDGLDFLHRICKIIHTDVKPDNILLVVNNIEDNIRDAEDRQRSQLFPSLQSRLYDVQGVTLPVPIYRSCPLVSLPPDEANIAELGAWVRSVRIKITDLGNALERAESFPYTVQTPMYRSPEVILECPWDIPVDIWSVGCVVSLHYL